MTKKELVSILNKFEDDNEIYVHIAYNTYEIRQIMDWGDFAVLNAGNIINPEPHHFDDKDLA